MASIVNADEDTTLEVNYDGGLFALGTFISTGVEPLALPNEVLLPYELVECPDGPRDAAGKRGSLFSRLPRLFVEKAGHQA